MLEAGEGLSMVEIAGAADAIGAAANDSDDAWEPCGGDWHREIDPRAMAAVCPACGAEDP